MPVVTQFSGSLLPGEYQEWVTTEWPLNWFVVWSVRPLAGQSGNVTLRAVTVEAVFATPFPVGPTTLNYHLTVWNVGPETVSFDALYEYTEF
jgi:hypothetical protein